MNRRPSDPALRRWLATGRPRWVGHLVATDPEIGVRLDELTSLSRTEMEALNDLVTPAAEFEQRTTVGVRERIDNFGTASALFDLLGLGFHVGRALLGEDPPADHGDEPGPA